MTTIFLVFLFITQLISFYFLALLNAKVSKFDDLEKRQTTLMREMDDSIGVYLSELKDENDRLIQQLATREEKRVDPVKEVPIQREKKQAIVEENKGIETLINIPKMPVNLVLKSYGAAQKPNEEAIPEVLDDKARAIQLHDAGHTIEEIAKTLGKGKTEVELVLKFR